MIRIQSDEINIHAIISIDRTSGACVSPTTVGTNWRNRRAGGNDPYGNGRAGGERTCRPWTADAEEVKRTQGQDERLVPERPGPGMSRPPFGWRSKLLMMKF